MLTIIPFSEFRESGRKAVIESLDAMMRDTMRHEGARGWTDADLRALFGGVDAHMHALAARINNGTEPGSSFVSIDMVA